MRVGRHFLQMKLLHRILHPFGAAHTVTAPSVNLKTDWLTDTPADAHGTRSGAGLHVTPERSLTASAVFACVRVIAEDLAKLPIYVYRRTDEGKERARDLSLYDLLRYEPNSEMGAFDFEQALVVSSLLWGNGYAEIVRNVNGSAVALWPLPSWCVRPMRDDDDRLYYEVNEQPGQSPRRVLARNILHVKGISPNGVVGWMMPEVGRESMGLLMAAQQFTASYFDNGASTGEAVIYPHAMKSEEFKAWVEQMRGQYEGVGRQHKTRYFDRDVKIQAGGGIDPEKSQLIETLHFGIEDVARYFRVQPHKIGHLLRATFNNIEHLDLDHYKSTLLPRLVQIEEELMRKLLDPQQRRVLTIKHDPRYILRADQKTETETISTLVRDGVISINEARELLDRNAVPEGDARG